MSSAPIELLLGTAAVTTPSWTPASLSGLNVWYDASVSASITSSGGAVSAWADLSGNSRTITSSGTQKPTTGTRTVNGLNVLDFDGANDYIGDSLSFHAFPIPITYFIVAKSDTTGAQRALIGDFFTNAGGVGRPFVEFTAGGAYGISGVSVISGGTVGTSAFQMIAVCNGASSAIYVNGSSVATGDIGTPGGDPTGFQFGATNQGSSPFWDGVICEGGMMSGSMGSTDRTSWNTYCAKWGL